MECAEAQVFAKIVARGWLGLGQRVRICWSEGQIDTSLEHGHETGQIEWHGAELLPLVGCDWTMW